MKVLKTVSHIFAILAAGFVLISILVATGVVGEGYLGIVMVILFVLSFFVGKPNGGMKAGILKLLIFAPVLVFAFIMGAVLILEFAWRKLIAFIVISYGIGHGVYHLLRLVDKKCKGVK